MAIEFSCGCGKKYSADDARAGLRIRCKKCGAALTVPKRDDEPEFEPEIIEPETRYPEASEHETMEREAMEPEAGAQAGLESEERTGEEAARGSPASAKHDLGEVQARHTQQIFSPASAFLAASVFLIFFVAMLVVAIRKPAGDKNRPAMFVASAFPGVIVLALLGVGAYVQASPSRRARPEWLLCAKGLLHRRGPLEDVFPWEELHIHSRRSLSSGRAASSTS